MKFRAWDKIENKMIYNIVPIPFYDTILEFYEDRAWDELIGDFEIMQYTGLKDKNGKEIYEGDIIKYAQYAFDRTIYLIGIIVNNNGYFLVKTKNINNDNIYMPLHSYNQQTGNVIFGLNNTNDVEVIGNIYEKQ